MLSDEEKKAIKGLEWSQQQMRLGNLPDYDQGHYADIRIILNLIEKQQKEIEELKAINSMQKYRIEVIDERELISKDTYIEKSKPYWEQIMTKDEMTIEEALTIIDDMYQDRYKIMSQKTEKETIVDLSKMDYIRFTNLEWASVRVLREVQSLNHKFKKLEDKIKSKIEEYKKQQKEEPDAYLCIKVLQSLLEKE